MSDPGTPPADRLSAEDAKLVTLARATRLRARAAEGAAVRDSDGRTYAAATVDLPSLNLSAVQACVAMVVAGGSSGLDAAVVLTEAPEVTEPDLATLRDLGGPDLTIHLCNPAGVLRQTGTASG